MVSEILNEKISSKSTLDIFKPELTSNACHNNIRVKTNNKIKKTQHDHRNTFI